MRLPSELVRPQWPPMAHIEAGWQHLLPEERAQIEARLQAALGQHTWGDHDRQALGRLFAFLAQVETIAIEIPLRALATAPAHLNAPLRQQLVDEVFHSVLFARLAHTLALPAAQPPAPLASAERLLQSIRDQEDMALGATLLNLVAEGWIETIFEHAATWGVADAVFQTVLADESRHVAEALDYVDSIDPGSTRAAVAALEQGLLEVSQEPSVGVAMLHLAGPERHRAMVRALHASHRARLQRIGITPSAAWVEAEGQVARMLESDEGQPSPRRLPDTPWRRAARQVWDTPRDPTMQGGFDLAVGHVPRRLLTPVLVAAIGRAWAQEPQLNRVVTANGVWQLPRVNVGVRVLVAEDELATVVITDADKRSVRDIARMVQDGYQQLQAAHRLRVQATPSRRNEPTPDPALTGLVPPQPAAFSVALSNPGKFGLVTGAGALSAHMAPSTDVSVGQRRRLPTWRILGYWPVQHVHLGCLQDHRVFDGKQAGEAMQALRRQLTRTNVRRLLRAPDTVPSGPVPDYESMWSRAMPPHLAMLSSVGIYKYIPWAIGGLGLGAALGIGGYYLVKNMYADEDAPGGSDPGPLAEDASGDAAPAPDAPDDVALGGEAPAFVTTLEDGRPRCAALTRAGSQCQRAAIEGGLCAQHGGA